MVVWIGCPLGALGLIAGIMVEQGTCFWLIRQMGINQWAREIGILRATNAQRLAAKEAEERERMRQEQLR